MSKKNIETLMDQTTQLYNLVPSESVRPGNLATVFRSREENFVILLFRALFKDISLDFD